MKFGELHRLCRCKFDKNKAGQSPPRIVPRGFEPRSMHPKCTMIGHYTPQAKHFALTFYGTIKIGPIGLFSKKYVLFIKIAFFKSYFVKIITGHSEAFPDF